MPAGRQAGGNVTPLPPRQGAQAGYGGGGGYGGYGGGGYGDFGDGGNDGTLDFSLRGLIGLILRGKWIIAGTAIVFFLLAFLFVNQMTPMFRATTEILVGVGRTNVTNIDEVVEDFRVDYFTNQTEAAVIRSRSLARQAVERLDLGRHPLYRQAPRAAAAEGGPVSALTRAWRGWLAAIGLGGPAAPEPATSQVDPEAEAVLRQETLTDAFQSSLSVEASGNARIILVTFHSPDPDLAAEAANTAAQLYIENQRREKGTATETAGVFLTEQVSEAQERLLASERALEIYRSELGIQPDDGISIQQEQFGRLTADLSAARTEMAEARARHEQVQALLRAGGGIDEVASVLDSSLIQQLRVQEIELVRSIAELSGQFREEHPRMILARAELADLSDRIEAEVNKIAGKLNNDYMLAQERVRNLEDELGLLRSELVEMNDAQVEMRALESEVRVNRALYDSLLQRLRETGVQGDVTQQADARIISVAVPPKAPYAPRTKLMAVLGGFFGGLVGLAIVVLLELLDNGYRSLGQLQTAFGVPALGLVPAIKLNKGERAHSRAMEDHSAYSEAIRTIRTALLLAGQQEPVRTLLVTSALPAEGKTSVSLSLAVQANRSGRKAIVIDCDMRRAVLASYLGMETTTGLSDYLAGEAHLGEIIQLDRHTGIPFIPAGPRPSHPSDMLASDRMTALLTRLRREFDLVILDSPPLMVVSDGLVLLQSVDRVLFLVRWAKTRRQVVNSAMRLLTQAEARLAGTVLTHVDVKKHAQYQYADSGYYYDKAYRNYYVTEA